MAIQITHAKVSEVSDSANTDLIQPSDWNANLVTSMATSRLVGRTTASAGPFEEITVDATLTLGSGSLGANTSYLAATYQPLLTGVSNFELGSTLTGDRFSYIDFHSDDTNTDWSLRIIRNPGVNGNTNIINAGTGLITLSSTGGILLNSVSVGDYLRYNIENQACSGGVTVTSKSLGTLSSGTLTLDMGDRPMQHYTNNGAHTLAPGSVVGSSLVDITNGASAGAITTTGWTKVSGDSFTTTNGHKFRCHCSVGDGGSLLIIQALQ